ncbi:MAG: hypothetical protein ABI860_01960 [Gemmatimonadales bacterium]
MIRLHTLGPLDLRDAAGREIRAVLQQPKSPFFSLASQRFLRARLLEELGRRTAAAGSSRSMAERSPYELVYARAAREGVERTAGENDPS